MSYVLEHGYDDGGVCYKIYNFTSHFYFYFLLYHISVIKLFQMYKIAKKTKNKSWKYYKMFDKHFGKSKILDKYESCKSFTFVFSKTKYFSYVCIIIFL